MKPLFDTYIGDQPVAVKLIKRRMDEYGNRLDEPGSAGRVESSSIGFWKIVLAVLVANLISGIAAAILINLK